MRYRHFSEGSPGEPPRVYDQPMNPAKIHMTDRNEAEVSTSIDSVAHLDNDARAAPRRQPGSIEWNEVSRSRRLGELFV